MVCIGWSQLAFDPLAFGPLVLSDAELWKSVRDASANLAQAAGFTDPDAVSKGYEILSTALRTGLRLTKGASGGSEESGCCPFRYAPWGVQGKKPPSRLTRTSTQKRNRKY